MQKVLFFGAGVQSTACLVLAAQGKIDYREFVFCNVGSDSENPRTLEYFYKYHLPYAFSHGLKLHEIQKRRRDGTSVTLFQHLMNPSSRSVGIPVRMGSNGAPGRRSCTVDFKIRLGDQFIKKMYGIGKILQQERRAVRLAAVLKAQMLRAGFDQQIVDAHAAVSLSMIHLPRPLCTVGLGISTDEWHRARNESGVEWKALDYPLLNLGISRNQCYSIIADAGLPEPPESACWFCPLHTTAKWQRMRRSEPVQFSDSCDLEEVLNLRRRLLGKDPIYFHRKLIPLAQAIPYVAPADADTVMEEQEQCSALGGCFL